MAGKAGLFFQGSYIVVNSARVGGRENGGTGSVYLLLDGERQSRGARHLIGHVLDAAGAGAGGQVILLELRLVTSRDLVQRRRHGYRLGGLLIFRIGGRSRSSIGCPWGSVTGRR